MKAVYLYCRYVAARMWLAILEWWSGGSRAFRVTKALAFDSSNAVAYIRKDFDPDTWLDIVRAETGWDNPSKLEVRYTCGKGAFRMVVRSDELCIFPPYVSEYPALGNPDARYSRVKRATLENHELGTIKDVTERVKKYEGPHGTFHTDLGLSVRVRDMFEWWGGMEGTIVRIEDSCGVTRDYSFDANDEIEPSILTKKAVDWSEVMRRLIHLKPD